jgi:transposase
VVRVKPLHCFVRPTWQVIPHLVRLEVKETPISMTLTSDKTQLTGTRVVVGGVDTHQLIHHAAVLDEHLVEVADQRFPVGEAGYRQLLDWMAGFGLITRVGVESTGAYGAGLTRFLLAAGLEVLEVRQPEKSTRVREGKSDSIDAYSAARQAATGAARAMPKLTTGVVEAIRMLKVARDGAVKDRTRAYSQLRDLATTAPAAIHDELIGLTGRQRVTRALRYRPDPSQITDPTQAAKKALRTLARRIGHLNTEITDADRDLARLTKTATPSLLAMRQVGTQTAAQILVTAGQNIDRMHSEAAFAKLCGVAPLPASSGKTGTRHRLNPGGDRHANSALHLVVIGRLKNHPETQAYLARRLTENKTKREAIRCLKRHLARSIYRALKNDLQRLDDL